MKQKTKSGDEVDCVSRFRNIIGRRGGWKDIKRKMNKRFRKDGKKHAAEARIESEVDK